MNSPSSSSDSEGEVETFDLLIEKLRKRRKKEARHSEEKVTRLESLLIKQQAEIDELRKTIKLLKAQEFHKKAKYAETSSAESLTSSEDEDSESESDFDDEGIESAPHTSYAEPSHPLLIDPILENIMKFLPLKSLLCSRLVCKKWNRFGHKYLLEKSDPVILEVHQPWKPSRGIKLSKFLEVMRNGIEGCPYSKYVIRSFNNLPELEKFFRKFGPTIKSLDLNFTREFDDNAGFRRVLFEYAPFVESLRIAGCDMLSLPHFWEYSEFEPSSSKLHCLKTLYIGNIREGLDLSLDWIREFLIMTPNLEKIILQVHYKDNGHDFIQTVLDTLLEVGELEKIKSIYITSLTENHLQTLIRLAMRGLKLKTFKFQDICLQTAEGEEQINHETIHLFLQSQSDSLEMLRIEQRSNRVRGFLFPRMNCLKNLTLITDDSLHCGDINYARLLPQLESLTLRGYGVFAIPHFFSELVNRFPAGNKLKKLSLPSGIRNETFPAFLATMFPNVKELEIRGASNKFLQSIWESWPNLEKVKMVVSHYDGPLDSGITGISLEECNRISNTLSYGEYRDVELESVKEFASLADLKNLRELEIECRSIWIPCHVITDVSGFFTFSNMPQLKSFKFTEIGVPENFDFSDDCIQRIHEMLPEADITFKIMDDHGRWQLELEETEAMTNMYETEPLLEDHNKDKVYCFENHF